MEVAASSGFDWVGLSAFVGALAAFSGIILAVVNSKMKRQEDRQAVELERSRREMDLEFDRRKKEMELEMARMERESESRRRRDGGRLSAYLGRIYTYMHKMMNRIDADRVFIIQPHPLSNKRLISVSLEVIAADRGVAPHKEEFQCKRISEWGQFVGQLSSQDWHIHTNIEEVRDKRVYVECHLRGLKAVFFRRMVDVDGNWVGTLCAEYVHNEVTTDQIILIKGDMEKKALLIQGILPEYQPSMEVIEEKDV